MCKGESGMIDRDILVNRFMKYVSFDTQSDEDNNTVCPSTKGQTVLAQYLAEELRRIGLSDVSLDEHGYVMATLPANGAEQAPVVGFISHLDTSTDAPQSGRKDYPVPAGFSRPSGLYRAGYHGNRW